MILIFKFLIKLNKKNIESLIKISCEIKNEYFLLNFSKVILNFLENEIIIFIN